LATHETSTAENTAKIVYILYLVSLVVGVTGIVGVVMAYINQDDAPEWLRSHYRFQIRTFWIGALYVLVGVIFAPVFVGFLVLLFWLVWVVVRCAKGIKFLDRREAYPDPAGWMY
jgi:uncharacterized membrane protein